MIVGSYAVRFFSRISVISAVLLSPLLASAQVFFFDEGKAFVDRSARERTLGIEIEFKGLDDQKIQEIVRSFYPEATITGEILQGLKAESDIGQIRIVIEGQAWRYEDDPVKYQAQREKDLAEGPREIVFPPVKFSEIPRIHALIKELQKQGAIGTVAGNAVSLQVNLQMQELKTKAAVRDLLNLLRVYYKPDHRNQVDPIFKIPKFRAEYIQGPSKGFMAKLNDPNYQPTPRELYDDFMYRQSLELKGSPTAWTAPIAEVKKTLLSLPGEEAIVPRVAKMNKIRISSLLLKAFPNDPLTKRVIESRWARPAPIVEFREFNNDFDLMPKVRGSLGVARAVELYGDYNHDELFSDLSGVSQADIRRLRADFKAGEEKVRYVLQDPIENPLDADSREWLARYNKGVTQIALDAEHHGLVPFQLPSGSVVWHRRNIHRHTILGDYNPGLENYLIQQVMENKLFEALLFEKYAPGAFPKTVGYSKIVPKKLTDISKIVERLNKAFPQGWVLKGAWDFSSEKLIITDKTNLEQAMRDYENGFEEFRANLQKQTKGMDPEVILYHMKKHPGYLGYKLKSLLKNPSLVLVQQRRELVEEFRVEVLGGKVLGQGSTIPRFAWMSKKKVKPDPKLIASVEDFTNNLMAKLPKELSVIPYGFDVALTKEGDWVVIESNPGGNSSFLEENPASSRALVEYLDNYPEIVKTLDGIMGPDRQMDWIREQMADLKMSMKRHYPGIIFTSDDIVDPDFAPKSQEKAPLRKPLDFLDRQCSEIFFSLRAN